MEPGEVGYVFSKFVTKVVDMVGEFVIFAFENVVPGLNSYVVNFGGVCCVCARGLLLGSRLRSFGKVHGLGLFITECFVYKFVVFVFGKFGGSVYCGLFMLFGQVIIQLFL